MHICMIELEHEAHVVYARSQSSGLHDNWSRQMVPTTGLQTVNRQLVPTNCPDNWSPTWNFKKAKKIQFYEKK